MNKDHSGFLKELYLPKASSHKGQNGKLLLIGGSKLFHAASLWALKVACRIVDLVHYASIPENNAIVQKAKMEFRDGIVISRSEIENYIEEDDCILIGPGMERTTETKKLTEKLLRKYPEKKWVIDAGSLQMMRVDLIPKGAVLTPHHLEFERLFQDKATLENCLAMAEKYQCTILLKGEKDIVCFRDKHQIIEGGNAGMTKGGTGDVLSGLTAALYCKNEAFLSAVAASYINKKAGDSLFAKVGYYFSASDLVEEIPKTMKELLVLKGFEKRKT